jgi:hypothetical protein
MHAIHVNFCYYSSSSFHYSPARRRLDSVHPHLTPFVLGPTAVLPCCCSKGRCVRRFRFHRYCYSATRSLPIHRRKGEIVLFFASIRRRHSRSPIPNAAMDTNPLRQVRMRFCHEATASTADADNCYHSTDQPLPHGALWDRQWPPSHRWAPWMTRPPSLPAISWINTLEFSPLCFCFS